MRSFLCRLHTLRCLGRGDKEEEEIWEFFLRRRPQLKQKLGESWKMYRRWQRWRNVSEQTLATADIKKKAVSLKASLVHR